MSADLDDLDGRIPSFFDIPLPAMERLETRRTGTIRMRPSPSSTRARAATHPTQLPGTSLAVGGGRLGTKSRSTCVACALPD